MSWICSKCEIENPDRLNVCEVCESLRYASYSNDLQDDEHAWCRKAVLYDDVITKRAFILSKYDSNIYKEVMKYAPNLLISADKGNPDAQYLLGDLLISHQNVVCKANAFIWFSRAAIQGNRNAMQKLAFCYEEGIGTVIDYSLAMKWYENAINKDCELKEEAQQGFCRIQKKIAKTNDKVRTTPKYVYSSKQPISFTAKYYISGKHKSYKGSELAYMELPKGTLVRKMLTEEWIPIESIEIPKHYISETSYYYVWGMKGVYNKDQLKKCIFLNHI